MYIPKRWIVPGLLSLVLVSLIAAELMSSRKTVATAPAAAATLASTASPADCEEHLALARFYDAVTAQSTSSQSESNVEEGDFATNSGTISGSQFNDGGFGDIGQQWWNVTVHGNVTNVHVSGNDNTTNVTITDPAPAPPAAIAADAPAGVPAAPGEPAPEPAPAPVDPVPADPVSAPLSTPAP